MPGGNLCVLVAMQKVKDLSFKPVRYICLDRVLVTSGSPRNAIRKAHVIKSRQAMVNGFEVSPNYVQQSQQHLGVSKNRGKTPKSSILIGFSIIFTIHFGGFPPIFGSTPTGIRGVRPAVSPSHRSQAGGPTIPFEVSYGRFLPSKWRGEPFRSCV